MMKVKFKWILISMKISQRVVFQKIIRALMTKKIVVIVIFNNQKKIEQKLNTNQAKKPKMTKFYLKNKKELN